MSNTNTLDLNQPFGKEHTLSSLKKSLDQFFIDYEVSSETITQIREKIAAGYFHPLWYEAGKQACIIGLYTLCCIPDEGERTDFHISVPGYDFEGMIRHIGINPGDTPETNVVVAQLDSVLALCQTERSAQL